MNALPDQKQTVYALSAIGIPSAEWKRGPYDTLHQYIREHPETNRSGTIVILSDGSVRFYD